MRAFSQLLDDLVYTRSRNTKLRLIGDYLKETPDPDRGFGLAALTGTLDIPAVKHAAVRAIAEERVDPVLLYMSRDYVGDMAETVALLWPTSADGPSRGRRRDDPHFGRGRAAAARHRGSKRRARSPRCSTISMPRAGSRCSSSRPAGFGSGSARGSPSRRSPTRSGSRSRRSRRCGMG